VKGGRAGVGRQRGDDIHLEEQYGGMEVNEARRLKELEDENRRLEAHGADLSLDREAL